MALIDDAKIAVRTKTSDIGIIGELQDLIDTAKADLKLAGVLETKIVDTDILIKRAILLYCKANYGLNNANSEKFQQAYESLKIHLTLSQEYTIEVVV